MLAAVEEEDADPGDQYKDLNQNEMDEDAKEVLEEIVLIKVCVGLRTYLAYLC